MEEWKDVVGFEEYFQISSNGRVKSKRTNKILKTHLRKDGRVTLTTKIGGRGGKAYCFKVHRLVAEAFIPNHENKPTVNHKDGVKSNNFLCNLEWATYSENIQHAFNTGLNVPKSGYNHCNAKMLSKDINYIRSNYKPFCKINGARALAEKYGVAHSRIVEIYNNRSYKE